VTEESPATEGRQRSGQGQLSHSTGQVVLACEFKFHRLKVLRRPPDADIGEDTYALRFGSAVHHVMEHSLHSHVNYRKELIIEAMEEYELEADDFYKIYACCQSLYKESLASGLTIVGCEHSVSSATAFGFVDAVGVDSKGRWWIMDLKTTGQWKPLLPLRLRRDPQLSVYSAHAQSLAIKLGLSMEMFAGVVYRAVTKSRIQPQRGEKLSAYAARAKCQVHSVIIPLQQLQAAAVFAEHNKVRSRAEKIISGEIPESDLIRNYSQCIEWNRPCECWSECYGKSYTECVAETMVSSLENPIDIGSVEVELSRSEDMLNISNTNVQIFNDNRIRVDCTATLGAAVYSRSYYAQGGDVTAAEINAAIEAGLKAIQSDLYVHLAALADSPMYQNWTSKLGVPGVPATAKAAQSPAVVVIPPPAKPEPKVEAPAEEVEEPKPAAKPAKAAAAKPAKAKKVDEKVYEKGVPEYSTLLKAELEAKLGAGWSKNAAHKAKASEIATGLVESKVIVLRDGEVTQEFKDYVAASLCDDEAESDDL
jgi:hypothetical protein